MKAVVFDLDGTLVDSSTRFDKCREETGLSNRALFWECFLSEKYMDLDSPREEIVNELRQYLRKGYKIIILTGRVKETQEKKTIEQLRKWGICFHEIIFRRKGDYRKDYVFKLDEIAKLLKKYEIEAIYDDREDVLRAIKSKYPWIKTFLVAGNIRLLFTGVDRKELEEYY